MYRLKPSVLFGFVLIATLLVAFRGYFAITDIVQGDPTRFLAFPMTVILPAMAFTFLVWWRDIASQEGVLMQLGAMIQILLIIALPDLALYLALGVPVVFLVVELFVTKMPASIVTTIKDKLVS